MRVALRSIREYPTLAKIGLRAIAWLAIGLLAFAQGQNPMLVDLPLTGAGWTAAVSRLSNEYHRPIGIEISPGSSLGPLKSWTDRQLDLTGLDMEGAIALLQEHDPSYTLLHEDGMMVIRPRGLINSRDDFLNRRLARCDLDNVTIIEALTQIHRYFDPQHPAPHRARSGVNSSRGLSEERRAGLARDLDKRFSVHLANASVRAVLDAVVQAHGGAGWVVGYRRNPAAYENVTIRFLGFDNWSIGEGAHASSRSRP
jgi:hypothetical protein